MKKFLKWLDDLAGTNRENTLLQWLELIAFVFLVLMVVSAPHSIAATQTAWIIGMFVWSVGLIATLPFRRLSRNNPAHATAAGSHRDSRQDAGVMGRKTLLFALWGFFIWSVITSVFSYDPATSLDKLRGTALFLIVYFVIYNLRSLRAVYFIVFALILSCMVNVVWTPVQRLIGRGVEIHGLRPESPLAKALLWEGDTLLTANGKNIGTPENVLAQIEENEVTNVKFYRPDFEFSVDVKRADVLSGSNALERLGIESWKKSRNWRSSGFYGHYTTYAEVLQLIISLVFGLIVARLSGRRGETGRDEETSKKVPLTPLLFITSTPFLLIALVGMSLALLLTVTRASQLALIVSAFFIILIGAGRKWLLAAAVVGLPVILIGLFFLQQSRQVGFFDPNDESIRWRQTVWREGFDLWTENPRHFVFGVGMDSIKKYAKEWHLFDDGRLNMGHFHSTPLQLLVERGLPALLIWLIVLGIYARTLWKGMKSASSRDWRSRGILLGCLGGMIGFFTSSLVHYNLGDQEVVMVFFLLMGMGVKITELAAKQFVSLPTTE